MKTIITGELSLKAFNRGTLACQDAGGDVFFAQNPYKEESKSWQSWNYGWETRRETNWRKL